VGTVTLTTIKLTAETRDRLRSLGMKGETYDNLLNRLINEVEAHTVTLEETTR